MIVEDRNDDGAYRNLIEMRNSGPLALLFDNRGDDPYFWRLDTNGRSFNINDGVNNTLPFRVMPGTANNALVLSSAGGVGINTSGSSVAAMLHVRADGFGGTLSTPETNDTALILADASPLSTATSRIMAEFRNNGQCDQILTDTSGNGGAGQTWRIRSQGDRVTYQDITGYTKANMAIFNDGAVRYSVGVNNQPGTPNMTVRPNGDVNIIGQPANTVPFNENDLSQGFHPKGGNLNVNGDIFARFDQQ